MTAGADRWIRWTTTGCVALLALIAGTVSYLHMHLLVELHGQPGWVAALTPLSGGRDDRGGLDHTAGRITCGGAWREAALGAACCRQRGEPGRQRRGRPAHGGRAGDRSLAVVRPHQRLRAADAPSAPRCRRRWPVTPERRPRQLSTRETSDRVAPRPRRHSSGTGRRGDRPGASGSAGRELRRQAWRWALAHRTGDGLLPSGREIASQYGRQERWGRLVKRSGATGELDVSGEPGEPGLHLVRPQLPIGHGPE